MCMQCNVHCNFLLFLCGVIGMASYYYFPFITFELSVAECRNNKLDRHYVDDGEESRNDITMLIGQDVVRTNVNDIDGFAVMVKSDEVCCNTGLGFLYLYVMATCVFLLCSTFPEYCFRKRVNIGKRMYVTVEKECGCTVMYSKFNEP